MKNSDKISVLGFFFIGSVAFTSAQYPPNAILGPKGITAKPAKKIAAQTGEDRVHSLEVRPGQELIFNRPGQNAQFTTTIQFAVQERTPRLLKRSQDLVIKEFSDLFTSWPEFQGRAYRVSTEGEEVVVFFTTSNDTRQPLERAMTQIIGNLNGRVRAHGRSQFYRTSLSQPTGGLLEVIMDNSQRNILSISAQSVPFRDILKEIKAQSGNFSYLIPGRCAGQLVDWSFDEGPGSHPKPLETALRELGALFGLKLEKQSNTYIFNGVCPEQSQPKRALLPPAEELLQGQAVGGSDHGPMTTEVLFPIMPLTR